MHKSVQLLKPNQDCFKVRITAGMKLVHQFWSDEAGHVSAFSTVLMMTIVVIGIIPGVVTIRDQLVQEFGDVAGVLVNLDQSYSFTINGVTSVYSDTNSIDCDAAVAPEAEDNAGPGAGDAPAELNLTIPAPVGE